MSEVKKNNSILYDNRWSYDLKDKLEISKRAQNAYVICRHTGTAFRNKMHRKLSKDIIYWYQSGS